MPPSFLFFYLQPIPSNSNDFIEGFPERETSPRPSTTTDYYEIFEAVQQQHSELWNV